LSKYFAKNHNFGLIIKPNIDTVDSYLPPYDYQQALKPETYATSYNQAYIPHSNPPQINDNLITIPRPSTSSGTPQSTQVGSSSISNNMLLT